MAIADRHGWDCVACGGRETVAITTDTRTKGEGAARRITRRRKCRDCGARITTVEVPEHAILAMQISSLSRLKRRMLSVALHELGLLVADEHPDAAEVAAPHEDET